MSAKAATEVLILVYSRFGVLERLAGGVAQGAQSVAGVEVHILGVEDEPIDHLRPGETEEDRACTWA
jgi:hypothetical protein